MLGPPLSAVEAQLFEDSVVPRYLSFFGASALEMMLVGPIARVAHVGCRTGFPVVELADKIASVEIVGVDGSPAALDLARARAGVLSEGARATYEVAEALPTPLPDASFTHALTLAPVCDAEQRGKLFRELRRVLVDGGQALVAIPLRGSFSEIGDMVREFALRQDLVDLGKAVDAAAASRPSPETLVEELEDAGLSEVDVNPQLLAVSFNNGREFIEDPIARFVIFPDLRAMLPMDKDTSASCVKYVGDAISKYWSEGVFELTLNIGCVSARRL